MSIGIWIIIGALIVIALILLKFKEIRHRLGLFTIITLLLFFVVSFGYITKSNNIDLGSFDGVVKVSKIYFTWLRGVFTNVVSITGNVIHQDWGLNSTDSALKKK